MAKIAAPEDKIWRMLSTYARLYECVELFSDGEPLLNNNFRFRGKMRSSIIEFKSRKGGKCSAVGLDEFERLVASNYSHWGDQSHRGAEIIQGCGSLAIYLSI